MTEYLAARAPKYVEDFRRGGPDWWNGYASGGDSDSDWLPAFGRAVTQHLTTRTSATLPKQRTYAPEILLGKELVEYPLSGTLNLFGCQLRGIVPGVQLTFATATIGVHVHYPDSGGANGTSHWLTGIWAPFAGYGGGARLEDVLIQMGGATIGSIGLLCQYAMSARNVTINDAGYHGIYISAGFTSRVGSTPETLEFPGVSNSNTVDLDRITINRPGARPGTSPFWVTEANPAGNRPYGHGLKIEGPDANDTHARRVKVSGRDVTQGGAMGFAIDDNSFLGCTFIQCFSVNNERYVSQWEHDIVSGTFGEPTDDELDEFAHPVVDELTGRPTSENVAVGGKVNFAFRSRNSSGSEWLRYYIEGATPRPIEDIRSPAWRLPNSNSMPRNTTWGHRNYEDSANNEFVIANGDELWSAKNGITNSRLALTTRGNFFRLDYNGTNNAPAYYTGASCLANDGRTLATGRMIVPGYYRSGSFAGGAPGACHPREYGAHASRPALSSTYPDGSEYEISDPVPGGAGKYRAGTLGDGSRVWLAQAARPLVRGVYDRAETNRPTISGRVVSLARASGMESFTFVSAGIPYRKTSTQSTTIADTDGVHWIYFDAAGTLTSIASPTGDQVRQILSYYGPVAVVVWSVADAVAVLLGDERHGQGLDPSAHLALHSGLGARLSRTAGGYAEISLVDDGNGDDAEDAQIAIDTCTLLDEDIDQPSSDTPQILDPAELPVVYFSGSGTLRVLAATAYPLLYAGHGLAGGSRSGYNLFSGGVWSLAEVGNNDFVLTHVFAWNDTRSRYVAVAGQATYATQAQARAGATTEIKTLYRGLLPFPEFKAVATLIAQTGDGYANTPKARWRPTDTGDPFVDWRDTIGL